MSKADNKAIYPKNYFIMGVMSIQNMVSYGLFLFIRQKKLKSLTRGTNSMQEKMMHSMLLPRFPTGSTSGIICGQHRGSLAVRGSFAVHLGITSGLGIICGAVHYVLRKRVQ